MLLNEVKNDAPDKVKGVFSSTLYLLKDTKGFPSAPTLLLSITCTNF